MKISAVRQGAVSRALGFERMVAQVCLGKVGAVCAREVSRFARNSREWQHLVEVFAALSTRCSSITRRCIRRAWAMIACFWG